MRKIRFFRLRARLSQRQLASMIGVSQATVSYWENGLQIPPGRLSKVHKTLTEEGVIPPGVSPTALEETLGSSDT